MAQRESFEQKNFGGNNFQNQIEGGEVYQAGSITINREEVRQQYFSLFGNGRELPDVDWDWGMQILRQEMQPEISQRLKDSLSGFAHGGWAEVDAVEMKQVRQEDSPLLALEAVKTVTAEGASAETLDPTLPIIQTYAREDIKGKLLILGAPGSGKTITLLRLAQQLVMEAIAQPKTVIPIIFELSTWRDDKQNIEQWLIEQLYDIYGGNRKWKIYETWLERRVLLPLLDGLDELGMVQQQKCTPKLNDFAQHYPYLVVCCRDKEFRQAGVKLSNLRGTVQLQSLSNERIQDYLRQMGKSGLWQQIQSEPEMLQLLEPVRSPHHPDELVDPGLLRIPLFISLAARVYEPERALSGKIDLFERYINFQLSLEAQKYGRRRKVKEKKRTLIKYKKPKKQQVYESLSWVGNQLKRQNKVDFLIEGMQPNWLGEKVTRRHDALIAVLISGLVFGLIFESVTAVKAGLYTAIAMASIGPKKITKHYYNIILGLIIWLISGLIIWLACGMLFGLITGLKIGSFIGLLVGLHTGLIADLDNIQPYESFQIPISYAILQETLGLLKNSLVAGLVFGLVVGLSLGLGIDWVVGLTFGLSMILIIILILVFIFLPILIFRQELKIRSKPNQGIWNSLQGILWISLFAYPTLILIVFLLSILNYIPEMIADERRMIIIWNTIQSILHHSSFTLHEILIALFSASLLVGWSAAGMACIQHLALRLTLTCYYPVPWNLARFLNYCTECRLLQRIGGRYRFIHRELLDHFANLESF